MTEIDRRFKELIEPLKDLAANWDVDIADSLNVYLEELEQLQLSMEGPSAGLAYLNFAEAALLIQGSTSIYSRKVEYLHKLVMQSLEYITNQRSNGAQNGQGKGKSQAMNNSYLEEERLLFGSDPSFLLLDDIVAEAENIDLAPVDEALLPTRFQRRNSSRLSISGEFTRNSMVLMHSILHEDHGSTNLKMSSCKMDVSGALMIGGLLQQQQPSIMPVSPSAHDHDHFEVEPAGDYYDNAEGMVHDEAAMAEYEDYALMEPTAPAVSADPAASELPNPSSELATGHTLLSSHTSARKSNRNSGSVGGRSSTDPTDVMRLLDPHEVTTDSKPLKKGRSYVIPKSLQLSESLKAMQQAIDGPEKRSTKEQARLQSDIDSTAAKLAALSTADDLRFKESLGSCFRYVDAVLNPGLHKLPLKGFAAPEAHKFARIHRSTIAQRLKEEYGASAAAVAQQRLERALGDGNGNDGGELGLGDFGEDLECDEDFVYGDPETQIAAMHRRASHAAAGAAADTADEDVGGFWGDFDGPYNDDGVDNAGFGAPPHDDPSHLHASHSTALNAAGDGAVATDEGDVGDRYDHLLEDDPEAAIARFFDEDEAFAKRVEKALEDGLSQTQQSNSYEMLCRRHIENFMRGAEHYARETQLSKRVHDWTMKLEPLLRDQEMAPAFDIHAYSAQILAKFSDMTSLTDGSDENNDDSSSELRSSKKAKSKQCNDSCPQVEGTVRFDDVVNGQSREEVCRAFLACLQLANLGNILVVPPSDDSDEALGENAPPMTAKSVKAAASHKKIRPTTSSNAVKHSFSIKVLTTAKQQDVEQFRMSQDY